MSAKQPLQRPDDTLGERGAFRQPPGKRGEISEGGRKWKEEDAEAAKAWAEWVEKNGVPLRPLF